MAHARSLVLLQRTLPRTLPLPLLLLLLHASGCMPGVSAIISQAKPLPQTPQLPAEAGRAPEPGLLVSNAQHRRLQAQPTESVCAAFSGPPNDAASAEVCENQGPAERGVACRYEQSSGVCFSACVCLFEECAGYQWSTGCETDTLSRSSTCTPPRGVGYCQGMSLASRNWNRGPFGCQSTHYDAGTLGDDPTGCRAVDAPTEEIIMGRCAENSEWNGDGEPLQQPDIFCPAGMRLLDNAADVFGRDEATCCVRAQNVEDGSCSAADPCPTNSRCVAESGGIGACQPCGETDECGCTSPSASNYQPNALHDDGSCLYHDLCSAGYDCYESDVCPEGAPAAADCTTDDRLTMDRLTLPTRSKTMVRAAKFQNLVQSTRLYGARDAGAGGAAIDMDGRAYGYDSNYNAIHLIVVNSEFLGNNAENAFGGAIKMINDNEAAVLHSIFRANTAWIGGAIYATRSTLRTSFCLFEDNWASGSYGQNDGNGGYIRGHGGAIALEGDTTLVVDTSIFRHNWAPGTGGAISANMLCTINAFYSTFDENEAGAKNDHSGNHLFGNALRSVKIVETVWHPFAEGTGGESVYLGGALGSCDVHPCAQGEYCSYVGYSLSCVPCPSSSYSDDGMRCKACPPGFGPNPERTDCIACVGTTYSTIGLCESCDFPNVVDPAHETCSACAPGQEPNANRTACTNCVGTTYSPFGIECQSCESSNVVNSQRTSCTTCGAGTGPNADRTGCDGCTGSTYSPFGIECQSCESPNVVNSQRTSCTACGAGTGPNADRTGCDGCTGVTYSTFGTECSTCEYPSTVIVVASGAQIGCANCPAGQGPQEDRLGCVTCSGPTYSTIGVCESCDGVVDPSHISCTKCPANQKPDLHGAKCICSDGNLNASMKMKGYVMDYAEPESAPVQCLSCLGIDGITECANQSVAVSPGWFRLVRDDGTQSAFQCKQPLACSGTGCSDGYRGVLCGACQDGYDLDSEGRCNICGEATLAGTLSLVAALILVVILASQIDKWYSMFSAISTMIDLARSLELQAMSKILVAAFQIISNFAKVLNISFPGDFRSLLRHFSIFRFDVAFSLGVGCMYSTSYFASLLTSFGSVILITLLVAADYLYLTYKATDESQLRKLFQDFDKDGDGVSQDEVMAMVEKVHADVTADQVKTLFSEADADGSGRVDFAEFCKSFEQGLGLGEIVRKARQTKALEDTLGRFFLLVFLLYPGLTSKIFEIFLCRDLGPHTSPSSVLHADYEVDCDETWALRWGLGGILVLIWPLGLPAGLLFKMMQVKDKILAEDEDTLNMFSFLIGDYKIEYWYWEIVELGRKLMLTGLMSLLGRGSIAQAAIAALVSFAFFAASMRALPFKSPVLNFVKMFSEVQLFVVLQICVILQQHEVGWDSEVITVTDYGVILIAATLLILPIAIFLIFYNLQALKDEFTSGDDEPPPAKVREKEFMDEMETDNPLREPKTPNGDNPFGGVGDENGLANAPDQELNEI